MSLELSKYQKNFLTNHKELLQNNNFVEFFKEAYLNWKGSGGEGDKHPANFTDIFVEAGITPEEIMDGMQVVPEELFTYCDGIVDVVVPASVESLKNCCFEGSSVTNLVLNDGLETIGDACFRNCKKLHSVKIPESVKSIGAAAFRRCASLTKFLLPGNSNIQAESIEIDPQIIEYY